MTPLNHPNLVKLYGGCWNEGPDKLCLVLEFCPMGSLRTLMDGKKGLGTWADPRFNLTLGISRCFKYLHHGLNDPVIHRDLKPDNIQISEDMQSKVADFGESRFFNEKRTSESGALTMTMVGTALYCAPEAGLARVQFGDVLKRSLTFVACVIALSDSSVHCVQRAGRRVFLRPHSSRGRPWRLHVH